jgi:penicillin amidase
VIVTANNRPAADDYPYPLAGTWSSGHRARRIRQMLAEQPRVSRDDVAAMHLDVLSLRAVEAVPQLVKALGAIPEASRDPRVPEAVRHLEAWDRRMEPDRVGAALFDVFFVHWSRRVARARFDGAAVPFLADAAAGLAVALLAEDPAEWFVGPNRETALVDALLATIEDLTGRFGPDMAGWTWGRLHAIHLRHVLSGRGDLGRLLDRGGVPVRGNGVTVCNTGFDPNYLAPLGANYRLIADFATDPPALHSVDAQGASGHPGSPHYGDQLAEWLAGRYHYLPLDRDALDATVRDRLTLEPDSEHPSAGP